MGRATSNGWLTFPHVASAEAVALQPWDSITLDMHHGFIDLPDLVNLLAALGVASRMLVSRLRPPRRAATACTHLEGCGRPGFGIKKIEVPCWP